MTGSRVGPARSKAFRAKRLLPPADLRLRLIALAKCDSRRVEEIVPAAIGGDDHSNGRRRAESSLHGRRRETRRCRPIEWLAGLCYEKAWRASSKRAPKARHIQRAETRVTLRPS